MPILKNQRHELFAQKLAAGESASSAYVLAGFKESRKNASRLKAKDDIAARVQELQAVAARSTTITIESICRELDEANAVARERGQAAAMVSASALRAKLAGLMVEKVEVGDAGSFDDVECTADIADRVLAELVLRFRPIDEKDRQGLIELFERQFTETHEFLNAIRGRPIIALRVDMRDLQTPWQELPQYGTRPLRRLTNGGNR